jgi:hypothetical protein
MPAHLKRELFKYMMFRAVRLRGEAACGWQGSRRSLIVWGLFCAPYMSGMLLLGQALLHCWCVGCDPVVVEHALYL